MRSHAAHWLALGWGTGLSPIAPGTVGTLWAWASFAVFNQWLSASAWGAVLLAGLVLGCWACTVTARNLGVADPSNVVWDEIIAFWLVLWVLTPASLTQQLWAFVLFRFFDAVKPGPVAWVDAAFKQARGWRQGLGIVLDDLVAALLTLLTLALWRQLTL